MFVEGSYSRREKKKDVIRTVTHQHLFMLTLVPECSLFQNMRLVMLLFAADVEGTEMGTEGHAVIHLDESILHRIKHEPSGDTEIQQSSRVVSQRQMNENLFENMSEKDGTTDDNNWKATTENDTGATLNEESLAEDSHGNVEEAGINKGNPVARPRTGIRRSKRQRVSVRRLSSEHKETESYGHRRRKVTARMHPSNSPKKSLNFVRRKGASQSSQQTLPNVAQEQDVCSRIEASLVIKDTNEVFKRRFRKVNV